MSPVDCLLRHFIHGRFLRYYFKTNHHLALTNRACHNIHHVALYTAFCICCCHTSKWIVLFVTFLPSQRRHHILQPRTLIYQCFMSSFEKRCGSLVDSDGLLDSDAQQSCRIEPDSWHPLTSVYV